MYTRACRYKNILTFIAVRSTQTTVAWYRCTTPILSRGHRRSPPPIRKKFFLNMGRERRWPRWIKKASHIGIKRLWPKPRRQYAGKEVTPGPAGGCHSDSLRGRQWWQTCRRKDACPWLSSTRKFNTLRPRQKWPAFSGQRYQIHFLEWKYNLWISPKISLKFVLRSQLTIFQHYFR